MYGQNCYGFRKKNGIINITFLHCVIEIKLYVRYENRFQ